MRGEVDFLYSRYSGLDPCLASLFCSSSGTPLKNKRVQNDAGGESYLSPVVSVGQAHGQDGQDYKVGSSSKVCHLVKFECAGNNEE